MTLFGLKPEMDPCVGLYQAPEPAFNRAPALHPTEELPQLEELIGHQLQQDFVLQFMNEKVEL